MSKKTLFELVNDVNDEQTFLNFIKELTKDRIRSQKRSTSDDWQNDTIENFLEASYSWGEISKNGLKFYKKPENPWKRCAQILYMGKINE